MARLPRLAIAGHPHLVLQRTLPGQAAFADDDDRRSYLRTLHACAGGQGVEVHGYGLYDEEIRLLLTPRRQADDLGRVMQALGRAYVAGFNRRHGRRGTLWDGRFRATVLDAETALLDALQFVETPPDGTPPDEHPWTSAAHHLGRQASPVVTEHPRYWRLGNTPFDREAAYRRRLVDDPLPAARSRDIAQAAAKGWALGGPAFLSGLAELTERPLSPRPRGRPRSVPN